MYKTQIQQKINTSPPLVKIGPKHQVTIPKSIFKAFALKAGDIIEMTIQGNKIIIAPKEMIEKVPGPKLSPQEQKTLARARKKIRAIQKDILSSKGLTLTEANLAAKVNLIDPEQRWWWTEEWQKGERQAEADILAGRVSGPFDTVEELLAHLKKQKV